MSGVTLDRSGHEVARDDTASLTVYDDEVEHFVAVVHLHGTSADLARERLVSTE